MGSWLACMGQAVGRLQRCPGQGREVVVGLRRERVPCDMPGDKAGGGSEESGMVLPVNTGQAWLFSVNSDSGQGAGKRGGRGA